MTQNVTYMGMDVHKKSIDIAMAESGRNGEVQPIESLIRGISQPAPLVYELKTPVKDSSVR